MIRSIHTSHEEQQPHTIMKCFVFVFNFLVCVSSWAVEATNTSSNVWDEYKRSKKWK